MFSQYLTNCSRISPKYFLKGHIWCCEGVKHLVSELQTLHQRHNHSHLPVTICSMYSHPPHFIFPVTISDPRCLIFQKWWMWQTITNHHVDGSPPESQSQLLHLQSYLGVLFAYVCLLLYYLHVPFITVPAVTSFIPAGSTMDEKIIPRIAQISAGCVWRHVGADQGIYDRLHLQHVNMRVEERCWDNMQVPKEAAT